MAETKIGNMDKPFNLAIIGNMDKPFNLAIIGFKSLD
jgi:hypothetical protein